MSNRAAANPAAGDGVRPEVSTFAPVLAQRRLSYCILHGWQARPQASFSDVDVATTPDGLVRLEQALRNGECGLPVQLFQHEASGYYFVLAVRRGQATRFIALDVATDYRCGGHVYFSARDLLQHRRRVHGLWVAAPRMEFEYLLVKKISKRVLPEHQKGNLRALCSSLGEDAYAAARRLLGARWGPLVVGWLMRSEWGTLEQHLARLRRILRRQAARRDPFGSVRYRLSDTRRRWLRWRYPTGLCVAVLGPDGAGKTTLVDRLGRDLSGAFRRTAVFHLCPPLFDKTSGRGPVTDPHGKAPHPFWVSVLKIPYYVLTYGLGYQFRVRPRLMRSTLVLFDRYYDDVLADPRRYRYAGPAGLARLGRRLVRNPDLYLVLDAPGEDVWKRKREVSPEEVARQRDAYRRLAADLPRAVLLDGSLPVDEVARNAGDVIVDYLRHRYISRRSVWFSAGETVALDALAPALCSPANAVPPPRGRPPRRSGGSAFVWIGPRGGRRCLIPLEPRAAAARALDLCRVRGAVEGVKKGLLGATLRLGLGRYVAPAVELVIPQRAGTDGSAGGLLLEHLESVLGCRGLGAAVSLGAPGPRRKPVLLLLSGDGKAIAYVKIGVNDVTDSLVQRETDALTELGRRSFHAFAAPRVRHSGRWNGHTFCVLSAPDGNAVGAPGRLTAEYASITRELAGVSTDWVTLTGSDFWRSFLAQVDRVPNTHFRNALEQGVRNAERWIGEEPLPFHFSHGDFGPWNMRRSGERVFLFDWEDASRARPPGWDMLHFLFRSRFSPKRRPHELCTTLVADAVARAHMDNHLTGLGLRATPWTFLWFLYFLDRLAFHGSVLPGDAGAFPEAQTLAGCLNALSDSCR